jgi:hypothetical protein
MAVLSANAGRTAAEVVSAVRDWHVHRVSAAHGDDAVVLVARFVP